MSSERGETSNPTPPENEATRQEGRAFDQMYSDFAPRVRGHLLRLTNGDAVEADDLTQDTFAAAFAGRNRFRGLAGPFTYLIAIARRRWRDSRRKMRPEAAPLSDALPDSANVEATALRAAALERALSQLGTPARNAVLLVLGKGLTYAEAAKILGEPVGTVKWRVHEATRILRRLLSEEDAEGNEGTK